MRSQIIKTGSSDGKTPGEGSQQKDGSGEQTRRKRRQQERESRDGENAAGEKGDKAGSKEGEAKGTQSKAEQDGKQADKQQEKDGKEVGKQGEQKGGEAGKEKRRARARKVGRANAKAAGSRAALRIRSPVITGSAPEGDAANLEYARKQTDLVLDKLAESIEQKQSRRPHAQGIGLDAGRSAAICRAVATTQRCGPARRSEGRGGEARAR